MPINEKRTGQMMYYYQGTNNMSGQHVLGQRNNMIGYTLDGVEAKEPGVQTYEAHLRHFERCGRRIRGGKVYTTGTPAEVGHSAGGLQDTNHIYRMTGRYSTTSL
jgi:hypothetical protein